MELLTHALRFGAFAAVLLGAAYLLTRAQEARPSPVATLFSFGKDNPDCTEWTNACQVCARGDDGEPKCSTAGIACAPAALVCNVRKPK
jgi:hypothetical protein